MNPVRIRTFILHPSAFIVRSEHSHQLLDLRFAAEEAGDRGGEVALAGSLGSRWGEAFRWHSRVLCLEEALRRLHVAEAVGAELAEPDFRLQVPAEERG